MAIAARETLRIFAEEMSRLRSLAGAPSLNELVLLAAELEHPLARSTISDKLAAKSLPSWDFVVSFVTACRRHAEKGGVPLPVEVVDLASWDVAHRRMLQAIDLARGEGRLVNLARAAIQTREHLAPPAGEAQAPVVPRQLPAPVSAFAGRTAELSMLDELRRRRSAAAGRTVVISAIAGTAGVGKTALAVWWAHRVAEEYPDGQLYVNLRGFDPHGPVVDPTEALRGFLDAFGIAPKRIPATLDAQAAMFRSVLATRRVLVLLDNARDAAQVRPLLPGSPGCLVLVTSRNQLASLVAVEGAYPLVLGVLAREDARLLLARRLGEDQVAAEPDATETIIARCARLPLALAIVAARAAIQPVSALATLATQLGAAKGSLDVLAGGDAVTDLRAVFSWSYRALTPAAARVFRLLGLHPGPDATIAAVASLAGLPRPRAGHLLAELLGANLLAEHTPGRYLVHDLLRAYARELTHALDDDAARRAAVHRLLDHYLHSAYAAARILHPHRDAITLAAPQPGTVLDHAADHQQAMAWFTGGYPVLRAALDHAVALGRHTHAWQLAWTMWTYVNLRGNRRDGLLLGRAAVAAAGRLADVAAQASAHRVLAGACIEAGRLDEALDHLGRALEMYRQAGDRARQARTQLGLALVHGRGTRYADALAHATEALALYRATGYRAGQAEAHNTIGWYHALRGEHRHALPHCQRALALHRGGDDRNGQAHAWDSLAYCHHHLGHHRRAITCYRQALRLFRQLENRDGEADTLIHLGDAHRSAGSPREAGSAWRDALTILTELDHADVGAVRARLASLRSG
jgi:tetratricopeptide (TPR) repeat protein